MMSRVSDNGVDQAVYVRICQFFGREATLLDENRLEEWAEALDEDVVYEVPIRLTDARGGNAEFPPDAYRVRDNRAMIIKRIERVATGEAWAESPRSRTVRMVGSIAVEAGAQPDVYKVDSAVLVYRQRAQDEVSDLIPARRRDILRVTEDSVTLVRRTIILAETVLTTPNLGIFL